MTGVRAIIMGATAALFAFLCHCLPATAGEDAAAVALNLGRLAESKITADKVDGREFIERMNKAADDMDCYSFDYTMKVFKDKKTIVERGDFYYKEPGLIRLEEKGPYKKGAVAILGRNGKVRAHLGGGLKLFVVELDPESGLLRSANGHPMVQSDLKSLARALRAFVKQGVKTHVTKVPIDLGAGSSSVHILDLHKSGKLWKRVAVDSSSLLPVKWWDYNDEGGLHSFATWEKLVTNRTLSDQLFTMKGDVKNIKDKQVSQTIKKEIQD
ncbi:MAG: DUF1571 domain-containing protein [Candidatus Melainabacteria bacterium]|nr:DUF1571 domain-containing protein [Candidatus Melainabacteria bacterium]